jgi:tetratricopeptide (TPR) repeat protein
VLKRLILSVSAAALVAAASPGRAAPPGGALTGAESPSKPAMGKSAPAPQASDEPVDESALRYYASLRQTARVEAETRRLQRLHPGWKIPDDLYAVTPGGIDEAPLWDLFAADRLDDLRAAIDARRAADPGWRLSDDFARKLQRKEVRAKIMAGAKTGRWLDVANLVTAEDPAAIDEKDVEALWTVAAAYAQTSQPGKAVAVYQSILNTSDDPNQRIATIQKAMSTLRMTDAEKLIAMARPKAEGRSEFEAVAVDITRARISAFLHEEWAAEVTAADLRGFQDYARGVDDPNQAGLVAWWYYKRRDLRDALEWFKLSLERGGDAMIAHGLAHTLRRLGMLREAEEVAYAWREPLVNNAILFIDLLETDLTKEVPPYIEPERIARYAQVTLSGSSGEGAQALAWYAYNSCQFDVALEWFQRAVAWFPKEATVYGYALTLRRLKRQKDYLEIVNRYDGLFPKVVELLFPEEPPDQPPTACEQKTDPKRPDARSSGDARAQPFVAPPEAQQPLWGRVPKPFAAGQPGLPGQPGEAPALKRNEFPLQVASENPLRFAAARPGGETGAAAVGFARERAGAPPLVARRVPGVAAMPYERFGYALLPGWDGADQPTWPPASARPPASGTVWAQEMGIGRPTGGRAGSARPVEAGPGGQPAGPAYGSPAPPSVGPQRSGSQAGLLQP